MRFARLVLGGVAVLSATAPGLQAAPTASTQTAFYMDVHAGQCIAGFRDGAKHLQVVPCSNPAHNLEVFTVSHGGWGQGAIPARGAVLAIGRSVCVGTFQRRFHHTIRPGYGWYMFWPDAGKEQLQYGDRVICALVRYPTKSPMGAGFHHQ